MTTFTPHMIEMLAKGYVSLNEDQPTHIKEASLVRLLTEIIERAETSKEPAAVRKTT